MNFLNNVGNMLKKGVGSFGSFKPMNTLNSDPGQPKQPRPSPTLAPEPKRQKQGDIRSRLHGQVEDIVDTEQDTLSKTENHGSRTSLSHSASPGVTEYQTVEAFSGRERSHRRRRQSPGHHLHAVSHVAKRQRTPSEPIEDFDELAQPKPTVTLKRRRLLSKDVEAARSKRSKFGDAADGLILGIHPQRHQYPGCSNKGKERRNGGTDEDDELAQDSNDRAPSEASDNLPIVNPSRCGAPSGLSQKGELSQTKWAKEDTSSSTFSVTVKAAVCQPNFRYLSEDQGPCYLRQPTTRSELRAFTGDGESQSYDWLKISEKVNTLAYHPNSNLIKISQAMDQSSSIGPIGGAMVIKFLNNSDASSVVDWVSKNLKNVAFREEKDSKLLQVYDNMSRDINFARAPVRRPSQGSSALPQLAMTSPLTTGVERRDCPSSSTRTPIRNQMQISLQTPSLSQPKPSNSLTTSATRSLRSNPVREQTPDSAASRPSRWTEKNPNWEKEWKMPLVFHRTTVDKEDIPRLDEGECLNDNLIGFGLRYLFDRFLMRHPDLNKRVYLHNSFFYAKLKAGRNAINYEGVKSWTAKVDLLAYDYIVVPVNEHYHWWVAIICNPGKLDPDFRKSHRKTGSPEDAGRADTAQPNQDLCEASSDVEMTEMTESMQSRNHTMTDGRRDPDLIGSDIVDLEDLASTGPPHGRKSGPIARRHNPEDPRIITLDSMGVSHPQAVSHLKKYILAEFEHKRGKVFTEIPQLPGMKAVNIPQQNNFCDCGVYLLGYIQEFVRDPDRFIQVLLQREAPDWDFKPAVLRELWRDTIKEERDRYQKTQESERIKREASAGKRTPTVKAKPETHSSRANSEAFDISKGKQGRKTAWSERSGSAKIASSPTDAQEFGDSSEAGSDQHKDTRDHVPSSAPTLGQASQQLASQQDAPDEVVLLSPRKNGVLPSIEAPEVEELPGRQDEPAFIAKLPTSPPRPSDDGHIVEVPPSTFYRSNSAISRKVSTRPSLTPSSVRQHTRAVKTQPAARTESRFVLDDDDIPVVQRAELVRQSDTIDLTD